MATLQELGIDHLDMEARLALAEQLWESVAAEMECQPLTDAQHHELERRVRDADNNPQSGIAWETIRAEARTRWQR